MSTRGPDPLPNLAEVTTATCRQDRGTCSGDMGQGGEAGRFHAANVDNIMTFVDSKRETLGLSIQQ